MNTRIGLTTLGLIAGFLICTLQLMGQTRSSVSAILNVQPFPSPYASDWQRNPSIATLVVTNGAKTPQQVIASLTISTSAGTKIVTGNSDVIALLPGTSILNNTSVLHGNLSYYNSGLQTQMAQTGRIPEGSYEACLTITDNTGSILVQNVCASFTIVYPDPPHLVFPANGDTVNTNYPLFQWTPLQVPIQYQLHYVLKVVEVLPGQNINQAISANIPQYTGENVLTPTLQYPITALPLKGGSTYAWQVQALDQNGFPPASNQGESEIWTFTYKPLLALHFIPQLPQNPPFHYISFSTSTVTGNISGTFSPPTRGMVIINKGNVPNKQPFPLGNTTVELVTKYMLIQKGNVLNPFGGTELSIPRSSLPGDHRYDDADQVVATTTTDPSGNFSFSFLQTDSTGLLETNQTINLLPGDLSNYQTGDLYKVYRVIVESPYYLSPDQDVIIQPYENKDVGSLSALVKTYSLKITVMPTSYKASSQATQVPLGGTYVYILRQSRPLGVPGTEGYPSPPSSQTMAGMEVVAEGQADENGEATLSDLVQNMGPNDQYFISAVTDPKSDKNYFYVTSSFQFSYSQGFGQTLNYTVSPNNFFTNPATYNSEYLIPTVSTTITMFPMLPRIAGTIYRADNPNAAVSGAQVQSLTYALFFWNTENSQPTQSNGSFEFDNLQPTYDDNANINGPIRGITITKYGFKDTSFAVNNGAF